MLTRLKHLVPLDLVRIMVGTVFLSEGIQKFLFPADGLWAFLHEARTDWCMFLGCRAVILAEASRWRNARAKP